jgi:hypothetical protein
MSALRKALAGARVLELLARFATGASEQAASVRWKLRVMRSAIFGKLCNSVRQMPPSNLNFPPIWVS